MKSTTVKQSHYKAANRTHAAFAAIGSRLSTKQVVRLYYFKCGLIVVNCSTTRTQCHCQMPMISSSRPGTGFGGTLLIGPVTFLCGPAIGRFS